jgi:hypothetical protein
MEKELNYMPTEIFNVEGSRFMAAMETVSDSADVFDEDSEDYTSLPIPGTDFRYIAWGADDQLPYHILRMIGSDEVMSQNKLFNVLTCYGAGMKYVDMETGSPTRDKEIRRWQMRNALPSFFLEQATDMKYYFFCVSVVILSRDGSKITSLRHKDACYCRFEQADKGKVKHVFYGNFRKSSLNKDNVEVIRLLDEHDPMGELNILMGREPGPDGKTYMRTKERKFAILVKFPTPGNRYYPIPNYTAIFRGDWYDIKRLVGKGKKAKLRNHASVKYQVEIHKDFWQNLLAEERITDPVLQKERIKREKENIKNFVAGIENSGKVWITGYYLDPNGKENRMVRINVIDASKEGGDWSEDIQEAANITCYGDNIHPNLVGATPGKSTNNNSGSDKRELFTLKQAIEVSFHDLMATPHNVVIEFNGWAERIIPDVQMILLTTLDQHTDAKKISSNSETVNND